MPIRADEISAVIRRRLENLDFDIQDYEAGTVLQVTEGVARVYGLRSCVYTELLEFPGKVLGLALNLEEDNVGCVILGPYTQIREGDEVRRTGRIASIPVGDGLTGRVVTPVGSPLDGGEPITTGKTRPMERIAPGITARHEVDTPLQTGIKAIDALIPIGRGQRELILGDRQTGKTAIAIDAIINQKNQGVLCIYVAIGQKASTVAGVIRRLKDHGAMDYTTVVATTASDPAPLLYLAPFAGTAIAEEFMEQGRDVLIVYDDLSKHARAYREMSLLLRRPPGREAFPGDIFYLHSRLLERAANLKEGGSITALPIVETQQGEISAYIPTNIISITDGQIILSKDYFNAGIRPAINVGLSVSRVGGQAQLHAMRQVAGQLRLDLAQYRELKAFTQFGADVDAATKAQLERGARITELLKQDQYEPMAVEEQVAVLYAGVKGYLDDVPVEKVRDFEKGFLKFLHDKHKDVLASLREAGEITDELDRRLGKLLETFKEELV
ncbi:MAG: F0F1 ATP synthase subunit alpha [Peptococcaceae bacterium]|nr:F0F1 ATP synthase subunit alpha [Peptococcaceae bacterium]